MLCSRDIHRWSITKVHIQTPDSNLVALNHACEFLQTIRTFTNPVLVQTNEAEIKEIQTLLSFSWFKPENALNGDSLATQICVSDSRGRMFSAFAGDYGCRIGPETRNSARIRSVVVEIFKKHCAHTECVERRPVSKITVSDLRCWMFSAFVGDYGCRIGLWVSNGAWMRSAVAKKNEKHWFLIQWCQNSAKLSRK
jgi:hypothetical protein